MFKQLSPTSWIRASEIESLTKSGTDTVIQMRSGRVFRSSYPMEYYLDGLGPVGIKDYEESLAQVKEHLEVINRDRPYTTMEDFVKGTSRWNKDD